jgi:hypothetical protein
VTALVEEIMTSPRWTAAFTTRISAGGYGEAVSTVLTVKRPRPEKRQNIRSSLCQRCGCWPRDAFGPGAGQCISNGITQQTRETVTVGCPGGRQALSRCRRRRGIARRTAPLSSGFTRPGRQFRLGLAIAKRRWTLGRRVEVKRRTGAEFTSGAPGELTAEDYYIE